MEINNKKTTQGEIFKLTGNVKNARLEAKFGNGFQTKSRSAELKLKGKNQIAFNFMQSNSKKVREMQRLINF